MKVVRKQWVQCAESVFFGFWFFGFWVFFLIQNALVLLPEQGTFLMRPNLGHISIMVSILPGVFLPAPFIV
jgi:uncharacterized membrane protein